MNLVGGGGGGGWGCKSNSCRVKGGKDCSNTLSVFYQQRITWCSLICF